MSLVWEAFLMLMLPFVYEAIKTVYPHLYRHSVSRGTIDLGHGVGATFCFYVLRPQYLGTEYGEKLSLGGERERKTGIGQGCIIMHDFLNDMFFEAE